mgnify:CR=1 FL=1
MVKIKPLLPSLKERKRYILYEIDSNVKMDNLRRDIFNELRGFLGDLGLAKAGLNFVSYKNNKGILQVSHNTVDEVKTGLALIKNIGNNKLRVRTLKVSGVLNKLKVAM